MVTYRFYIGSTDTHDAHSVPQRDGIKHAIGIWRGKSENVRIEYGKWPNDRAARIHAQRLAQDTGNACVLVVRVASPLDAEQWRVARFLADVDTLSLDSVGSYTVEDGQAYHFVALWNGDLTAFLVDEGGNLEPVA